MKIKLKIQIALLLVLLTQLSVTFAADSPVIPPRLFREAPLIAKAAQAPILAATYTGKRVVAVGDFGIVILSDDGKSFRQAKTVPTRTVLTSVFFIDAEHGWAVGHDGTVIATVDAGETWQVLREESGKDRVLLSVWFENPQHGFAVGQFGLVLETADAGKTWNERSLVASRDQGEKHLMQIFADADGLVFIAAESGSIYRSEDAGRNWMAVQTDNKGSFWTGLTLKDGSVLVAGLRGHVYRSIDRGLTWRELTIDSKQSLTTVLQRDDGQLLLYGNSGIVLSSKDEGQSMQGKVRVDRANVTAAVSSRGGDILFGLQGVISSP